MNRNNLKIGVTGAAGLLGRIVCKYLLGQGYRVRGMYRNTMPDKDIDIEWVQGDVLDISTLEDFVKDCDVIVHAAAIVSFKKSVREELYEINIDGTENIVNILMKYPDIKLIHISSVAALGRMPNKLLDETDYWNEELLHSHYGKSKFLAEMVIQRGIAEGLDCMILNPSLILGQSDDLRSSSDLWAQIKFLPSFAPTGGNGYVDIKDVAYAVGQCILNWNPGEQIIISGHNSLYKEIYSMASGLPSSKIKALQAKWLILILPFLKIIFFFMRKDSVLSKDSIKTASHIYRYNNQKSLDLLSMTYRPLRESVDQYKI